MYIAFVLAATWSAVRIFKGGLALAFETRNEIISIGIGKRLVVQYKRAGYLPGSPMKWLVLCDDFPTPRTLSLPSLTLSLSPSQDIR